MPPRVALWKRLARCLLLLAVSSFLLVGSAVGNRGLVLAAVTPAQGGWVDVYGLGALLRPALDDDPGLGIGFSRRSYLFASNEVPATRSGWHVFGVSGVSCHQRQTWRSSCEPHT